MNSPQNVPVTRTPSRLHIRQSKAHARQTHIDSSMHFLMPPDPRSYSTTSHVDQIVNPIDRMNRSDGPWNSLQMRNCSVISSRNAEPYNQEDIRHYHQAPSPDRDNGSDSGYHTQPAHSVLSNEHGRDVPRFPPDLLLQASDMNVNVAATGSHSMARTVSEQRSVSQHSSRSGGHRRKIFCGEPGCGAMSKCISEHKYVSDIDSCKSPDSDC